MNTPTHAALNFLVLGRKPEAPRAWIVLGAVLPDVPMFAFFVYERQFRGEPIGRIFRETYFRPEWQTLFDAFHSVPIFALLGLWFLWRRNRTGQLFAASLLLHSLVDWPTHLEDAHAYFWPIWRKPLRGFVSYWHPGSSFWLLELSICASALAWLAVERVRHRMRAPDGRGGAFSVDPTLNARELASPGGPAEGRDADVRASGTGASGASLR